MLLDQLITIEKTLRNKILDKLPREVKKQIFDSIPTLTEELLLEEEKSVSDKVNKRYKAIKESPGEVFWDFPDHCQFTGYNNEHSKFVTIPNTKISTNGDIIRYYDSVGRIFLSLANESVPSKYRRLRANRKHYAIHRLVGCTFIPIPDELLCREVSTLVTNHKNLVVTDNSVENLEWVTLSGNTVHAQEAGAILVGEEYFKTKPILMEVIAENRFKGRKFVLQGFDHCKENGFDYNSLYYVTTGHMAYSFGHSAKYISLEEVNQYHLGMPEDIKTFFTNCRDYFSPAIKPVVGKVLTGPYQGVEFSMFGVGELTRYGFQHANVLKVCKGDRKSHRNCSWKQVSLEEGIRLHGLLTEEVLRTLQ